MILQTTIFIFIAICCVYLYLKYRPIKKELNKLPHEPEVNCIFGNVSPFLPAPSELTIGQETEGTLWNILSRDEHQREGVITFWIGIIPCVIFTQSQFIEQLLSSNVQLDKGVQYSFLHNWLGTGLLTSTGDKWRSRRKMLTPSFHFQILDDFIPIINRKAHILNECIDKQLDMNHGIVNDTATLYLMCSLDIICESIMGCDIEAQKNPTSSYVQSVHEMGSLMMGRAANPFMYSDFVYNFTQNGKKQIQHLQILHTFSNHMIIKRKMELKQLMDQGMNPETEDDMGRKRKLAFIDSLITEHLKNPSFTIEDIREEVDTFMFEGHDTTGWGMTWTTFLLGHHPEIQAKVHEEMDTIFGSDRDRDITMNDLREMKYLEMCIKESLRLYPSAPIINRKISENMILTVNDIEVTIPAGVEVAMFIYNLHRNKYLWNEPDKFDPERFTIENAKKRNPFSYIPFSAGPRNCIGQKFAILEEKTVLASIFRRFKVTSLVPVDEVILVAAMILKTNTILRAKYEVR